MSGPDGDRAAARTGRPAYALGNLPAELGRLRRQSDELARHSAVLLDRAGLRPGQAAADLGCGPSGILGLLAGRVGPAGRVTRLEIDPAIAVLAREFAAEHGLANVDIVPGDARSTGLPPGSFDLVHARTLLINVAEPAGVVAEMVRLARPGGWVVSLEPDGPISVCYPPHPAWDRLLELSMSMHGQDGADLLIGRRLPGLFRQAGLTEVGVEATADIYPPGHPRRTVRIDLVRSMRPRILERGLAGERELEELDRAAREHLDDPGTLVLPHLLFLAWGRKPLA
jgi:ubiquinone/menaquinone biosynthesis C-methylase UbiE